MAWDGPNLSLGCHDSGHAPQSFKSKGADTKTGMGWVGWEFCCFDFRNPKLADIPGCSQPSASCPGPRHPRTCPSTGAAGELRLCYGDITQTRPCSPRHLEAALPLARNQEKVKLTGCP